MNIECSKGTVWVEVGDRFELVGCVWEVVRFTDRRVYSPFGVGGTPVVEARHVSGTLPANHAAHANGGLHKFCGDSVAAALEVRK